MGFAICLFRVIENPELLLLINIWHANKKYMQLMVKKLCICDLKSSFKKEKKNICYYKHTVTSQNKTFSTCVVLGK